jgi:hypothetical protein
MGRKAAPQPLTLSDPTALGDDPPRSGETLQVYSPPNTRSPRSPRSPFRLTPKKSQNSSVGGKQSLQVADGQQPYLDDDEDDDGVGDEDDHPAYPPISSALHQPPLDTSSRSRHDGTQPYPGDEKPLKSGGFFFNFSKSKSNHQLSSSHHHSDSKSSEIMSRGTEARATITKSSKQSGAFHYLDYVKFKEASWKVINKKFKIKKKERGREREPTSPGPRLDSRYLTSALTWLF